MARDVPWGTRGKIGGVRPLPALVAACATVLALGACDVDVSQSDDREAVPADVRAGLAALWSAGDTDPGVVAEGGCFADVLTDRLSLDELVEAGLVRDDGEVVDAAPMLTVDVAGAWVDALDACTSYAEVAARTLAGRSAGLDGGLGGGLGGGLDEAAYARCLGAAVPPARVREALVATLTGRYGTDPAAAELDAAAQDCATSATGSTGPSAGRDLRP